MPSFSRSESSTYQLMTPDTDNGPIQVPVDVEAVSKMAEENRKRNAGAAARFRQRRREKERETSETISKLESQIRDIDKEKEYYRIERDYFRSLVYSTPARSQVIPRMPSPRQRTFSLSGSIENSQWSQSKDRGKEAAGTTGFHMPLAALGDSQRLLQQQEIIEELKKQLANLENQVESLIESKSRSGAECNDDRDMMNASPTAFLYGQSRGLQTQESNVRIQSPIPVSPPNGQQMLYRTEEALETEILETEVLETETLEMDIASVN